jgi:hypothetical protein
MKHQTAFTIINGPDVLCMALISNKAELKRLNVWYCHSLPSNRPTENKK